VPQNSFERQPLNEEKTLVQTPEAELLGIKDLIEGGTFKGQPDEQSSQEEKTEQSEASASSQPPGFPESMSGPSVPSSAAEMPSSYGPIGHRVRGKSDERALFRPPAMREDDFVEIMVEVVPELIDQALHENGAEASTRAPASKRPLDTSESTDQQASRPRPESTVEEALLVSEVADCKEGIDVLIAAHIQKKTNKELLHSGNPWFMQSLVNESKSLEWNTILEKGAVKFTMAKRLRH
jgi:hypothetical protein